MRNLLTKMLARLQREQRIKPLAPVLGSHRKRVSRVAAGWRLVTACRRVNSSGNGILMPAARDTHTENGPWWVEGGCFPNNSFERSCQTRGKAGKTPKKLDLGALHPSGSPR